MEMQLKPFEELTIQDDFMFYKVMQNKKLCKKILETILGSEIGKIIDLNQQKIIGNSYGAKGVRLDVLAKDEEERLYNIEMQMSNEAHLIYRLRYYQASLDVASLDSGQSYAELPSSIIIFLCNKDALGFSLPIYTFEKYCNELKRVVGDRTKHMILNYSLYEDIKDEDLKGFCKYCKTKVVSTSLTQEVDEMVNTVKHKAKARKQYSFLFDRYPDHIEKEIRKTREEGIEIGKLEGILSTARNLLSLGIPIEDVIKATGLSKAELEKL